MAARLSDVARASGRGRHDGATWPRWARLVLAGCAAATLVACQRDAPSLVDPEEREPPEVTSVEPTEVEAGWSVRLTGRGFHPEADGNLVLFDGLRGRVLSASPSVLHVEVPSCLPPRPLAVTVTVQGLASRPGLLRVRAPQGTPPTLALGEDRMLAVEDGSECIRLSGGANYLLVVQSAASQGGGLHPSSLLGIAAAGAPPAAAPAPPPAPTDPAAVWKAGLREIEARVLAEGRGFEGPALTPGETPVPPVVGERRSFHVLDPSGQPRRVEAVVRLVTGRAAFYQDVEAPAVGLVEQDLRALGEAFDDPVHGVVTGVFGEVSDLDGNGRVIVLLTPAVNRLTPPGSTAFVGGFFFGLDLLPEHEYGNAGEVLYVLVPDPEGRFGDPRPREQVLAALPAILAHEFQHMVHFHQRMRVRRAVGNEALWLSEALAQAAETLVGDTLRARGRPVEATRYSEPTHRRAREFLADPEFVSLIVGAGLGTLAERGAGWLFLRYLQGHYGGTALLALLTRTTFTGMENLEAATGRSWEALFSDWGVATFTDGLSQVRDERLRYPDFDLRRTVVDASGAFPLSPRPLPPDFLREGARPSASTAYYLLPLPEAAGPVAVRLAAPSGGAPPPEARLRLRVVRIR